MDGAHDLNIITSGTTTFGGAVGGASIASKLGKLSTTNGGAVVFNDGNVTTTDAQSYSGAVTLGAPTTLDAGAANVIFSSTVDGAHDLEISQASNVTFNGIVGGRVPLASLTTHAGTSVWVNSAAITTSGTQSYDDTLTLGASTVSLTSTSDTLKFVNIHDGASSFNLNLDSATRLALTDIDIGGDLHVTTHSSSDLIANPTVLGGVWQPSGNLLIGGKTTFTADTGIDQVAALTSTNNRFTGQLAFTQIHNGSWHDVSVVTQTDLNLASLQSNGSVSLQTQGAALTTSSITASANLNLNSAGGLISLGAATVTGDLTVDSSVTGAGGGNVVQTGQLVVNGNTSVTAGLGTITLDNSSNFFTGTLALQGQATNVATSGDLNLARVDNTGHMTLNAPGGSINLGTAFITGGGLTLTSRDDVLLGGANITGTLDISSTMGNISFGQATVTGDLIATTYGAGHDVDLGAANVGGRLQVDTHGGNIVQNTNDPTAALTVAGTSTFNAGSGNVTLPQVPNQFGGAVNLQAHDVQLVGSNGLILGDSTISGQLDVTVATGNLTQTGPLHVTGASSFTASQGDVVLDQANAFTGAVALNAVNATLQSSTALVLASSTVNGDLKITTDAGDVSQTGPLTVGGTTNVLAKLGSITLDDAANRFADKVSVETPQSLKLPASGALSMDKVLVGQNTDLKSTGVLDLGKGSYTGKLKANSGGFDIKQAGNITFGGDVDFDAGSAKIDLLSPLNMWRGAILFKGGIIMINHPVLMNAVNAGTLIVRANTTIAPVAAKAVLGSSSLQIVEPPAKNGPAVSVSVDKPATANQTGQITVAVSSEAAAPGRSFSFEMDPKVVGNQTAATGINVSQLDGKPLPEWLHYEPETKTFTAKEVPAGAFPLQLKVAVGGQETVMVIQEKDAR